MILNIFEQTEKLEKSGFTKRQAEATLKVLVEVMNQEFATKNDMVALRTELKHDMNELRSELKHDMNELRSELKHDMNELRSELKHDMETLGNKLTIRLGVMMTAGIGMIFGMLQFIR